MKLANRKAFSAGAGDRRKERLPRVIGKLNQTRKISLRPMRRVILVALMAGGFTGAACAQSQAHDKLHTWAERTAHDKRFQDSVDAFVASDREHGPKPGCVLFIGSSTIRFWETLAEQFDELPIVRRGFGGSRMTDVTEYLGSLVTPYKPRMIVVYAGDNDINEGATPQDVLQSFKQFVRGVRRKVPDARIAFVSIKPSPSRASLMPEFKEANALIRDFTHHGHNMDYIDTYSAMLDEHGEPRRDLFLADMLHMNHKGYAVWRQVVAPHLTHLPPMAGRDSSSATSARAPAAIEDRPTSVATAPRN